MLSLLAYKIAVELAFIIRILWKLYILFNNGHCGIRPSQVSMKINHFYYGKSLFKDKLLGLMPLLDLWSQTWNFPMLICKNPEKQAKTPESRTKKKSTSRLQKRLAMDSPFQNTSEFFIFAIKSQSQDFSYLCMRRHSAMHYSNLKYYFQRHVCLSIHACVRPSVRASVRRLTPIPAGESQDVTNKSCSICLVLGVDPWGPRCSRT